MKKITIDKIISSLEDTKPVITVAEDIAAKAKEAIERMVAVLPAK